MKIVCFQDSSRSFQLKYAGIKLIIMCAVRFYGYYQSALTVPDFSDILFQAGLNVILSIGNADQELSHRAKTVYMYLKDRSNADGTCWPSVRRIAEDLKLSRRTVQRALSDLEHHGFLERTHRRRPNGSLTSSLYRIK